VNARQEFASLPRPILCYITAREQLVGAELQRRGAVLERVAQAAAAGVALIQLREKDLTSGELEDLARDAAQVVGAPKPSPGFLVINSRTDVALAVGANGVHLPANDVAVSAVRRVWAEAKRGSECLVGISCHSEEEVAMAADAGADYVLFGPVFEKVRAPQVPASGLEALKRACHLGVPVLALGGVTLENSACCFDAGAAGIAGIRIFQRNDVAEVVRRTKR
jgi:thiamine-phosphate pyrophosphorylase